MKPLVKVFLLKELSEMSDQAAVDLSGHVVT